jgi:membrane protease YdiL (CAAX protease family)
MSVVIGAVYLRTRSLFLAMLMHWYINAVRDLSTAVFPGLPEGSELLGWCALAANALLAAVTIPALSVADRDRHL